MSRHVKDLTTDQLRDLIAATVTETMQDVLEDSEALSSPEYLRSIEEARRDYRQGRVKSLDEALGA